MKLINQEEIKKKLIRAEMKEKKLNCKRFGGRRQREREGKRRENRTGKNS